MAGRGARNVGAVVIVAVAALGMCRMGAGGAEEAGDGRPVEVRGVYGGVPKEILDRGQSLADYGINAVWVGSGGLTREAVALLKRQGAKVFAEFNTMHDAAFLKGHPDAAPVGTDGKPCPPPDGWQGVCPTHPGYREARMAAFRRALRDFAIDGIWLGQNFDLIHLDPRMKAAVIDRLLAWTRLDDLPGPGGGRPSPNEAEP